MQTKKLAVKNYAPPREEKKVLDWLVSIKRRNFNNFILKEICLFKSISLKPITIIIVLY
jgi:hypothetical protein